MLLEYVVSLTQTLVKIKNKQQISKRIFIQQEAFAEERNHLGSAQPHPPLGNVPLSQLCPSQQVRGTLRGGTCRRGEELKPRRGAPFCPPTSAKSARGAEGHLVQSSRALCGPHPCHPQPCPLTTRGQILSWEFRGGWKEER